MVTAKTHVDGNVQSRVSIAQALDDMLRLAAALDASMIQYHMETISIVLGVVLLHVVWERAPVLVRLASFQASHCWRQSSVDWTIASRVLNPRLVHMVDSIHKNTEEIQGLHDSHYSHDKVSVRIVSFNPQKHQPDGLSHLQPREVYLP